MQISSTPTPTTSTTGRGVAVLRVLVTLSLIIVVIMAVATMVAVFTSDSLVAPLELAVAPDVIDAGFPVGASITEADVFVDVEAGLGHRLLWWLVTDALAILAIPFLELIRRMLAKGVEPFTEKNASRLRWLIGLALAFAITDFLRPLVSLAIQDASGFDALSVSWDFSSLFVALLLTALLEVWRHGVTLRSDQELTI